MSPKHEMRPQVEMMDSRVLLSALHPLQRKFVDLTGPLMRHDAWSAPKPTGRSAYVYNFQGAGGLAAMGAVQTSGSVTDTVRAGNHSYRGNLTLANTQGSVKITIRADSYKITGGTGVYKGATGLGGVAFGTRSNGELAGLALNADM
ncbi:hypothetical protein [Singulisphaera acidiphila]|uniref:Uncharacterized protein n=1 Tax=Singulisphaera acidiphila (strain ATCC BAA-1392 / DSM 18658 / VKM B-2454 / MOB10) TaxID=886293 RepID=L0DR93_SINAD|nr:hypothetical protein [Singulisphaera acidiphila]AGA31497.1 hypothetical protein Sinac_7463 [Singulisphaera acidiphila DSM 18658]